ncbi:hypothetical protein ILYODFUR_021576 [Ilyodon furcidens]|uniref:Uncharacterized protein n=1 Tax=Ilyodon furcidens TaxID=33524 RepID=A0ABV0U0Q0_9TELE
MESQDRSRSPSRRTSRVEQVVGRWLRRSRDLGSRSHSLSRDRTAVDGKTGESNSSDQRNYPFRFNVQIQKDPDLSSHGLMLSTQIPILVQEVTPEILPLYLDLHVPLRPVLVVCPSPSTHYIQPVFCYLPGVHFY